MFNQEHNKLQLFMGGQDVIQEGDEEGDDNCFENEVENTMCAVYSSSSAIFFG